ncbi:MAG: hypothetical protein M8861_10700 [marine benthic group bacterium]|nr:hypothetical protein [Gemmatimonadota bacterium]
MPGKVKMRVKKEDLLQHCMFCGADLTAGESHAKTCGVKPTADATYCPLCGKKITGKSHTCPES